MTELKLHYVRLIAILLIAVICALAFISLFSQMTVSTQGLEFEVRMQISNQGMTQVEIPPLGLIRANTHKTPVKILVRLENIDFNSVQKLLQEAPNQGQLLDELTSKVNSLIYVFAAKVMALAALGGAFGVLLVQRKNWHTLIQGVILALLVAAILLTGTYRTYNPSEFRNPHYEGVLRAAPWMVSFAEEALGKIETLGQQLQMVTTNLNGLFQQIDQLQPIGDDGNDLRVLHVTDIHNNPAALDFMDRVTELFGVDLIIDTGDISDFGTPLESMLLARLGNTPVPYLFVPGNHDSPEIIAQMQSLPGVTVLDGPMEILGLKVIGLPDPSSATSDVEPPTASEIPAYAAQIIQTLEDLGPIDIIALHNNHIAGRLAGHAPVILYGHNHQQVLERIDGSVLVNSGSTGANGLQGLQSSKASHYSVSLLHFRPNDHGKLIIVAVDSLKVDSLVGGFSLDRRLFTNGQEIEPAYSQGQGNQN